MAAQRIDTRITPRTGALTLTSAVAAFEAAARSADRWLHTAEQLRLVADAIGRRFTADLVRLVKRKPRAIKTYRHAESGLVFLMLAGLALECIVKGILIKEDPSIVRDGRLPEWLTSHNLLELLKRVDVVVDEPQREFVRRAAVAVVWEGRYPVPTRWDRHDRTGFVSSADPEIFEDLYEPLLVRLQPPRKGRHGPAR